MQPTNGRISQATALDTATLFAPAPDPPSPLLTPGVSSAGVGAGGAFADVFLESLFDLGVVDARGVTGGPIARFVHSLEDHTSMQWVTCRTESGAVFQAIGAWATTHRPVLVVTTSGPGLLGVHQAMQVAKHEGAHLILVSPATPAARRGRHVPQGHEDYITADFLVPGLLFDLVATPETAEELDALMANLSAGFSRPGGFLAHVVLPSNLLVEPAVRPLCPRRRTARLVADDATYDEVAGLLAQHRFIAVVGAGAARDTHLVRQFLEATGAPVLLTPGAKGVVDERHPSFLGVSGIGGHASAVARVRAYQPSLVVAFGTHLSPASITQEVIDLAPAGVIHVDRDPFSMGATWSVPTLAVQSDLAPFLQAMLDRRSQLVCRPQVGGASPVPIECPSGSQPHDDIRPRALMCAVQTAVVDNSDAFIFVDVGSIWPWATSCLALSQPGRWSLETGVGCMGRAFAAAVGAALATGRKSVAMVGDWSADMAWPELRTAVDHDAPVVWVVANNAGGQMVIDGDRSVWQRTAPSARFRPGDLAAAARALGAQGIQISREEELEPAFAIAMAATTPFLLDVSIDTTEPPPYGPRFSQLQPKDNR